MSDPIKRFYPVPETVTPEELARDLCGWLENELGKQAGYHRHEPGWAIEVREPSGAITRMIRRQAESFTIYIEKQNRNFQVTLDAGSQKEKTDSKKNGILSGATSLINASVDMAENLASGISDLLVEKETQTAIFSYIGDYIANAFSQSKQRLPSLPPIGQNHFVQTMTGIETSWVFRFLEKEEILLAWLNTSSHPEDTPSAQWRFFLTEKRAGLAAFTDQAFEGMTPVPATEVAVKKAIGKDTLLADDITWQTGSNNAESFLAIAPLVSMEPAGRIRETARLNFLKKNAKEASQFTVDLLKAGIARYNDPLDELALFYCETLFTEKKENVGDVYENLSDNPDFQSIVDRLAEKKDPVRLLRFANAWKLTIQEKLLLAGAIQDRNPQSAACAELTRELLVETRKQIYGEKQKKLEIPADIRYAQNMILREESDEATIILKDLLNKLPDETINDLLPGSQADLTRGEGGQLLRVRILELMAEARGKAGKPDIDVLKSIAVLQPLVPERLETVLEFETDEKTRKRFSVCRNLLKEFQPPADVPKKDQTQPATISPLKAEDIENRLRHPASREGALFNKIQNFLATRDIPDHSALKAYARDVDPDYFPELVKILVAGTRMLDMKPVESFITYGEMKIGVKSYEASPHFLLIGGEHLEEKSKRFLNREEFCFAIGAELAHLKFKHERVTPRQVWEGAFGKAVSVIELFPVVGQYLGKIGRYGSIVGQVSGVAKKATDAKKYVSKTLESGAGHVKKLYRNQEKNKDHSPESEDEKSLIGAFREMQITADRAGLVLSGDPGAAVTTVFKTHPRLVSELDRAKELGLNRFLSLKNEDGELKFQELAVRLAAMFSFYLSNDYLYLRRATMPEQNESMAF